MGCGIGKVSLLGSLASVTWVEVPSWVVGSFSSSCWREDDRVSILHKESRIQNINRCTFPKKCKVLRETTKVQKKMKLEIN